MKIFKKISLSFILVLISVNAFSEATMTEVVYAELDQVDAGAGTLVVAGNSYRYQLDLKNSSYQTKQDHEGALNLNQLKPGNMYHFEMMIKGENSSRARFSDIIFISENPPLE